MFDNLFGKKKPAHEQIDIEHRFNLICRVGQGSMSKVWRAVDLKSGRTVALKILDREKTERYEARFPGLNKPSEGEVAVSLHHPNVVRTWEYGWTTNDEMFLSMEFVEGVGLGLLVDLQNEEMKRYRLRYMIQIGEALQYFHNQNWIHRDICPRNVMISENKAVKLIDFGLVVPNTKPFQKPGNRTGTASYMAPELIKRQPTDHRLDIFSYAVTCFEMYSRRFPWDAALTIDAVLQHINKPPKQIKDLVPGIDDEIAETIMKGLESNPADRWQHASDMVRRFRSAEARLVRAARAALAKRKAAAAPAPNNGNPAAVKGKPRTAAAKTSSPVRDTAARRGSDRAAKPARPAAVAHDDTPADQRPPQTANPTDADTSSETNAEAARPTSPGNE